MEACGLNMEKSLGSKAGSSAKFYTFPDSGTYLSIAANSGTSCQAWFFFLSFFFFFCPSQRSSSTCWQPASPPGRRCTTRENRDEGIELATCGTLWPSTSRSVYQSTSTMKLLGLFHHSTQPSVLNPPCLFPFSPCLTRRYRNHRSHRYLLASL